MQQLADAQATTFIVKDLEHRYLLVNQVFADSVGLPITAILGKSDLEIGIPHHMVFGHRDGDFPGFRALDEQAVAGRMPRQVREQNIAYTADAGTHHADTLRVPVQDENGEVFALIVQSRDITHVTTLNTDLQDHQRQLDHQDSAFTALDSVIATLMGCRELVSLLQFVADVVVERTVADTVFVMVLDDPGDYLEVVATTGADRFAPIGRTHQLDEGVAGVVWRHGRTIYLSDSIDSATNRFGWPPDTQRCALPLTIDGQVAGVLVVTSSGKTGNLESDIPLLERLARLTSIAMANARLIEQTATELERTRALSDLSQTLLQAVDPVTEMDVVCQALIRAVDASRVSNYMVDASGELLSSRTWETSRLAAEPLDSSTEILPAAALPEQLFRESLAQWCLDHDEAATIPRGIDDARESKPVQIRRRELGIGSVVCRVVKCDNQPMGVLVITRNGRRRDFSESELNVFRVIVDQLSAALTRRALADALHEQANHDSLTSLPNRRCFENELQASFEVGANARPLAIVFIDLDGFKQVNDTLGHAFGDELLRSVACRLADSVPEGSLLARMGGDEFAILLKGIGGQDEAVALATSCSTRLLKAFDIHGASVNIGSSTGVSFHPGDGDSADELLRHADFAMYQAKKQKRGSVLCFDERLATKASERTQLELEIHQAIEHEEFRLFYQPQVGFPAGRVDGVEALIRWQHPTRGLLNPGHFIPLAEELGLINTIGVWVLDKAVGQLAKWHGGAFEGLRMGINIAASQFQLEHFNDDVFAAFERHGVVPEKLELEITETVVMQDVQTVSRRFRDLRSAGVRVALDDFGTGYSSLSYLQDLPLDLLKIDRSFVNRLQTDRDEDSLIRAIQTLSSALGLDSIAEGIETMEQLERLVGLGCMRAQGDLFSPAVPVDALAAAISQIEQRFDTTADLVY